MKLPLPLLNLSLVILIVLLTGWSLYSKPWRPFLADISTQADEQITVLLQDGTELSLAGNSLADITIDDTQRYLSLIEGEFKIETSALCMRNLPVIVNTPQGALHPGDSRFSVVLHKKKALLSVHKGSVTLRRQDQDYTVVANNQVYFTSHNVKTPSL